MPKPLIGITTRNGKDSDGHPTMVVQHSYINAVVNAGGVAIPIPSILPKEDLQQLYSQLNGILFTGGGDVSLDYFPGSPHPRIDGVDNARDFTEISLMRASVSDGKPLLGICRGAQVMNIALGGTLYTHIIDQLKGAIDHDYPGNLRKTIVHPVNVDESSRSAEIFGETLLNVNSLHHQGLKDIAPGLRVVGHAPDGLAEVWMPLQNRMLI
ncbi:MAG: gamma-glutamyl-gamma-aminobutyrate hydrolase family protein [Anaerolineales bacterium]|uniref:gamma-glutamyl-gamma-aminobutyrate hydrolase family protein n=1 Tax=Candidatus Villigracilis proximus TaxID=3140683 RepID=UPI003134F89A|nr:gamma-glutamyl-gamma-aminobutyrate hydrolase family protein [Anaerolineales bacterium]